MTGPADRPSTKVIFTASLVGTSIEWYDYYIFGTASALAFGAVFFPQFSAVAGALAAFATFAVGFIVRPFAAAIIGHFGDRIGRKTLLVLTLVLTGGATALIGVLPTYAAIGVGAPILLVTLRIIQGFGVGGEWGGAILIATEHASPKRRSLYGSFAQYGVPIGVLTSNLVFLAISGLPDEDFLAYGWRIPFLISIVLVVIGLVTRVKLSDAPEFRRIKENGQVARMPFLELVRSHPRALILAGIASIAPPAIGYTVIVYLLPYGTKTVGFARPTLLTLILISTVLWIATIAVAALASDRFGGKRVYVCGAVVAVIWPLPMFMLIDTGQVFPALVAVLIAAVPQGIMAGAQGGLFTALFPVRMRYTGISLAYQFGGIVGGALNPLIATALQASGGSTAVALYLSALCVASLVAALLLPAPYEESASVPATAAVADPMTS
jgi:MFS family permease